ncbi:hypothetical protein [Rhizobium acidisoli]|nr:hypothetical protein [Rhizobium acidisoli]
MCFAKLESTSVPSIMTVPPLTMGWNRPSPIAMAIALINTFAVWHGRMASATFRCSASPSSPTPAKSESKGPILGLDLLAKRIQTRPIGLLNQPGQFDCQLLSAAAVVEPFECKYQLFRIRSERGPRQRNDRTENGGDQFISGHPDTCDKILHRQYRLFVASRIKATSSKITIPRVKYPNISQFGKRPSN